MGVDDTWSHVMHVAILGTGGVSRTLAVGLRASGHEVTIGTRDPDDTMARTEADRQGNPPFATWQADHREVALATMAAAAAAADLVILACAGAAAVAAVEAAGPDNLAGKVVVDVTNPLDFSTMPILTLTVANTDSNAEQIQRVAPDAKVVKALSSMTARLMTNPGMLADGDHTAFVSGDDEAAKAAVTELLRGWGWTDIVDTGSLATARGVEMLLPLWFGLISTLDTGGLHAFKLVR